PLRLGLARRRQRLRHRQRRDRGEFGEEPPPRLRACASPPPRPACPLPMPATDGRSTTPILVVHLKPPHPFDTSPNFLRLSATGFPRPSPQPRACQGSRPARCSLPSPRRAGP